MAKTCVPAGLERDPMGRTGESVRVDKVCSEGDAAVGVGVGEVVGPLKLGEAVVQDDGGVGECSEVEADLPAGLD